MQEKESRGIEHAIQTTNQLNPQTIKQLNNLHTIHQRLSYHNESSPVAALSSLSPLWVTASCYWPNPAAPLVRATLRGNYRHRPTPTQTVHLLRRTLPPNHSIERHLPSSGHVKNVFQSFPSRNPSHHIYSLITQNQNKACCYTIGNHHRECHRHWWYGRVL